MPLDAPLAAVIDTGVGAVQSVGSALYQSYWQNKNYQRTLDMLEDQRKYDSPAQQMQRFKDAGLNPNLIYGQMQSSASPTPMNTPSSPPTFVSNFQNAVMSQKQSEVMDSQILKNKADAALITSQIPESKTRQALNLAETAYKYRMMASQDIVDALNSANIEVSKQQVSTMLLEANKIIADTEFQKASTHLVNEQAAYQTIHNMFASKEFQANINKLVADAKVSNSQADLFKQQFEQNAQAFVYQLAIIQNNKDISSSEKQIKSTEALQAFITATCESDFLGSDGKPNIFGQFRWALKDVLSMIPSFIK